MVNSTETECSTSTEGGGLLGEFMAPWTEATLAAGHEVPAWATREECERPRRFQVTMRHPKKGSVRLEGEVDQIKCARYEGTTTEGRGWRLALERLELCSRKGCGRKSGIDEEAARMLAEGQRWLKQAAPLLDRMEKAMKRPTYSSRAGCEGARSYQLTRLLHDQGWFTARVAAKVLEEDAKQEDATVEEVVAALKEAGMEKSVAQLMGGGEDLEVRAGCRRLRPR